MESTNKVRDQRTRTIPRTGKQTGKRAEYCAVPSSATKRILKIGCIEPAVADDRGDLGVDASERARARRKLHYPLSLFRRCIHDVPIIRGEHDARPFGILAAGLSRNPRTSRRNCAGPLSARQRREEGGGGGQFGSGAGNGESENGLQRAGRGSSREPSSTIAAAASSGPRLQIAELAMGTDKRGANG